MWLLPGGQSELQRTGWGRKEGVTIPSASFALFSIGSKSSAVVIFPCPGSGVSPGIPHSLFPGVWGINFQELPSGPAWAHPLVRPFGSHWITMAWVPGLDHHCHCLLCKMTRRKEYYGFVKLHQELSRACVYWDLLLYPGLLSFPWIFISILTFFGSTTRGMCLCYFLSISDVCQTFVLLSF